MSIPISDPRGTWDPTHRGPVVDGKTYTPPTMTYLKDKDGNIVLGDDGKPILVNKPAEGMEGLTGRSTVGKKQGEFDGEMFLKLLIAQLKYQDPSKPTDSSQIMQQTATLSMVERMNAMAKVNEETNKTYTSMLAEQRISAAVALVGSKVEYAVDPNDPTKTAVGLVDSVKFDGTGPILSVGGKNVPYQDVTKVMTATSGTSTTGSTPPASSTA
ncbi:flagellar hook assembly protein FlgD [Austwickia chelonae]|uniref:flagellar hook assembly protein FlgD n=1 Tax=Austwickia chelonae TaxID=100225 RepID=UPI000E2661FF|nr:flagellar hook capping FlgD N-terminal domain-containing protein [Austwickia chelonae]